MDEVKIKIKLPKELIAHIPSFGEIDLDGVLEDLAKGGKRIIYEQVKDRVLERFIKENDKFIEKAVKGLLEKRKKELKKKIKEILFDDC